MATATWEDVLTVFAGSTQTGATTKRSAVADYSRQYWIASHGNEVYNASVVDSGAMNTKYDIWYSINYRSSNGGVYAQVIGCNLAWPQFESESTELGKFVRQGPNILNPLAWSPYQNDKMSVWSFDAAVEMLKSVENLLQLWVPKTREWAQSVNAPGADWQGSAAGEFRALLNMLATEMQMFEAELQNRKAKEELAKARVALGGAILKMVNTQQQYWDSRLAWPVNPLHDAVLASFEGAQAKVTEDENGMPEFQITTPWGDPKGDDFWKHVEINAKDLWMKNVQDILDKGAVDALHLMDQGYTPVLPTLANVGAVALRPPPAPEKDLSNNSTGNPFGEGFSSLSNNMNDAFKGMGDGLKDSFSSLGNNFSSLGSGLGSGFQTMGNSLSQLGGGVGGGLTGGGLTGGGTSGPGSTVYDRNGKPVFDANGNPVVVPPGGHIDPVTHQVIGADGKPVLDKNGNPITVPDGASTDTPGRYLQVPPGSHIGDNGHVIGPDGKDVLDRNGNPIVVDSGYTIGPDGTIRDDQGNPVSESTQLLADQRHAYDATRDSLFGGDSPNPFAGGGGGLGFGLGLGPSGSSAIGGANGLSTRSLANGGDPSAAAKAAAERAAAAEQEALAAAERQALTGSKVNTTGGSPMMPPMGAGAGAGAGNPNEKDKQRTTWLAEEEEVWGTETTAVSGVIGR
ncbi:hypothetical protein AB0K43_24105 [Kitasatospora sp. NPDC049258]|uniref:hypothetical protein n=1 Tax=Kitasatospora sp. NPDC049258 TaxID=3155394 RepID=UPI00344303AF